MNLLYSDLKLPALWLLAAILFFLGGFIVDRLTGQSGFWILTTFILSLIVTVISLFWIIFARINILFENRVNEFRTRLKDRSPGDLIAIEELFRLQHFHVSSATRSFSLALLLLIISIVIVVEAGRFLDMDVPKISSAQLIREDLSAARKTTEELETKLIDTTSHFARTGLTGNDMQKALEDHRSSPEFTALANRKSVEDAFLRTLQIRYDSALEKILELDRQRLDTTNRALALLLFRISVLAISIFAIIFLFKSYRANLAMANIFRARMIALLAQHCDIEQFSLRAAAFSAEYVDFGREIKHPVDHMLNAFRELGRALRPMGSVARIPRTKSPKVPTETPTKEGQ